jgi:hypothetical protein
MGMPLKESGVEDEVDVDVVEVEEGMLMVGD